MRPLHKELRKRLLLLYIFSQAVRMIEMMLAWLTFRGGTIGRGRVDVSARHKSYNKTLSAAHMGRTDKMMFLICAIAQDTFVHIERSLRSSQDERTNEGASLNHNCKNLEELYEEEKNHRKKSRRVR